MAPEALAQGVRTGSSAAWRVLYHELGERVHRMVYRMTGDSDLASDLTHDTFLKVFEKGHQYSGKGSLHGWVFRIAANLTKERLRRHSFRANKAAEVLLAPDGAPDRHQAGTESRMVLREAMEHLTDDYRTVLILHEVDGYTHDEIAQMLDIAIGTSKARVSRAKAQLRDILKDRL